MAGRTKIFGWITASLAFAFVLAGILFGGERWLGYGLMGFGVLLAIVDLVIKQRTVIKPTYFENFIGSHVNHD